jgi:tetratricopeptide (TPR) repeat protein
VPEVPEGYREVPEEDRKKAQRFFAEGDTRAATGQYDYAINMYLDGLRYDPDAVEVHQKLRDTAIRRKASGGKGLGMFDALKLKKSSKDDKENLLNAEKLQVYDPGEPDHMLAMATAAAKAGYWDTAIWIGQIAAQAEADTGKPTAKFYLALRDVFMSMKQWQLALDCVQIATRLKPQDMELQKEARNLAAQATMKGAGYEKRGSFRDQVRDMKAQQNLMNVDKEVADVSVLGEVIVEAEKQYAADPSDAGRFARLVDLLTKTEDPKAEERALQLYQEWFDRTKQFRYRLNIGKIRMKQARRVERIKRKAVETAPPDEVAEARAAYAEFRTKMVEAELVEYKLWADAYPTDLVVKFEIGKRQFELHQFDEAIATFQQARNDPKQRVDAMVLLGRAFFEAGYLDEANDTLAALIRDFDNRESIKYLDMCYWRGRVLEQKGDIEEAKKQYSAVFQVDSGYKDVAARIKRLRAAPPPPEAPKKDDDE